jgi:CRISPR-associated protein Csd1
MSWIQKLYETYENCQSMIGAGADENEVPLLPICHTTQKAHVEITIDQEGNFKKAKVISKDDSRTIIPCTESSGGRAGKKPETHPLCDKLQYVAGDFYPYGGRVTSGYAKDPKEPFYAYRSSLRKWCDSEFSHLKAKTVLKYIEKETVIKDLVSFGVLFVGDDNKLIQMWNEENGKNAPDIFKILPGKLNKTTGEVENWQADAFVRWNIEIPNEPDSSTWNDPSLFQSWQQYYAVTKSIRSLCYVTGKVLSNAEQHPAKLRNDADKAKLISSNDTSGFTFRGRFTAVDQACGVGFEVTQKAHNALRWLLNRQGYKRGDQAIVAWSTCGKEVPEILADPYQLLGFETLPDDSEGLRYTAQELALKLNQKISGYSVELGNTNNIVILGLDSATPGRMGITFYRELTGSDFLTRLEIWHAACSWTHNYYIKEIINKQTGKKEKIRIHFVGAPSPSDIAEAAYGRKVDDKLRKATVERILPCIIDGQKLPRDLVAATVRRASNRMGMDDWEWNKALSIACALYKKYQNDYYKEELNMALDEGRKTRDYLYGRLLALADSLEEWALNMAGENRQTNAARLMQRFAEHPYSTWRTLELALEPYKSRLGGQAFKRQQMISNVMNMFEVEDFTNDKRLSGEFLLSYHCQREALWKKEGEAKQAEKSDSTN